MSRLKDQEIIDDLKNGSTDLLLYLTKRYFQSSRRWLRSKGVRDADTPELFSDALVLLMREVQEKKPHGPVDFQKYLFVKIREVLKNYKAKADLPEAISIPSPSQLASRCFNALDEDAQQLLTAYFADNLSYEEIAVLFQLSNPAIAEHEVSRQMRKLEEIVKVALEA